MTTADASLANGPSPVGSSDGAGQDSQATYCDRCGEPAAHPNATACAAARSLEPPRYCAQCRRRLVVQVTPTGWTARCSAHGSRTS